MASCSSPPSEVSASLHRSCSPLHIFHVEVLPEMPHSSSFEYGDVIYTVSDAIDVGPFLGREPGMDIFGHHLRTDHLHFLFISMEVLVGTSTHGFGGTVHLRNQVHVAHVVPGVHSCVGAAGSHHVHLSQVSEGFRQRLLHTRRAWRGLPSAKRAAQVLQRQKITSTRHFGSSVRLVPPPGADPGVTWSETPPRDPYGYATWTSATSDGGGR